MKKYHQLLLFVVSALSLTLLLVYRHEYNRLHYVLEVFNFFGSPCNFSDLQDANVLFNQHDWGPTPAWQVNDDGYLYSGFLNKIQSTGSQVYSNQVYETQSTSYEAKVLAYEPIDGNVPRNCYFWFEDSEKPVIGKFKYSLLDPEDTQTTNAYLYICSSTASDRNGKKVPYAASFVSKNKKALDMKKVMLMQPKSLNTPKKLDTLRVLDVPKIDALKGSENVDTKNFDTKNFDTKNFDTKNFDTKNFENKNLDSKTLYLSKNLLSIENTNKLEYSFNTTACVSPGVSFDKHALLEFISYHKIIGIDSFVFYNENIPHRLVKILTNLSTRLGFKISFFPWNFPKNDRILARKFIEIDCKLRTLNDSKNVITLDLFEYIVPTKYFSFNELLADFSGQSEILSLPVQHFCTKYTARNKPVALQNVRVNKNQGNVVYNVYRHAGESTIINTQILDGGFASVHKYVDCKTETPKLSYNDNTILKYSRDFLRSTLVQLLIHNDI